METATKRAAALRLESKVGDLKAVLSAAEGAEMEAVFGVAMRWLDQQIAKWSAEIAATKRPGSPCPCGCDKPVGGAGGTD